jgi:hypothetical protein
MMNRFSSLLAALAAAGCTSALLIGCSSDNSSSSTDGGDTTDAPTIHRDSGISDDGGDDSSATGCPTPGDLSTWTPPPLKPTKGLAGACTADEIAGYDNACLATGASQGTCAAFATAHKTCNTCLVSKSTDPQWGALVAFAGVWSINLGGCMSVVAPTDTCAKSIQDVDFCDHTACDGVCVVTDDPSFTQWKTCQANAEAQGCLQYATAANCFNSDDAGTTCTSGEVFDAGTPFENTFRNVATILCGGGDGGAGDAGSTDAGPGEAGPPGDSGQGDTGPGEAGPGEAGTDAGSEDGGAPEAGPPQDAGTDGPSSD